MPSKPEQFCTELATHIVAASPPAGLTFGYGARELDRAGNAPRIMWRLVRGQHEGTNRPGLNPRPLFTRRLEIEAHLWGADDEQTELLLELVGRAVQKAAVGAFTPAREEWPAEDDDRRTHQRRGSYCVLTFELLVPVTAATQTTARVTSAAFDTSSSAPTDGQLDAGEEP